MKWLTVYKQAVKNNFYTLIAYRMNFVFTAVVDLLRDLLLPLVTVVIYSAGLSFPGWSFYEALLIQSVFLMSMGVANIFFFGLVGTVMQMVRDGTFDLVLLRPGPIAFISVVMGFQLVSVNTFISGAAVFIYCMLKIGMPSGLAWLQFLFLFISGVLVLAGCALFMAATAFKWVGNGRIFEIFDSITSFGKYPAAIYPKWINNAISYIIPVAMLGSFPAQALLGRLEPGVFISVLPCLMFFFAGIAVFNSMVRYHTSAGG